MYWIGFDANLNHTYQIEFASTFSKPFYERKYNVFLTAAVDPL